MIWTHRTIIVPAAHVTLARALCATVEGGSGMLTTPLSPTGAEPATHYISAGLIWEQFADLLADAQAIYDHAQGSVSLDDIQAMLSASVIRADSDPHAVLAELGLQLVQDI